MATVRNPIVAGTNKHQPLALAEVIAFLRNYRESAAATTLTTTDDIVCHTGAASAYTLPAVTAGSVGKVYTVLNHGSGTVTLSVAVRTATAATTTTVAAGASLTFISTGTQYRRLQ